MSSHGIHHVTMIAGDPQANLDFYSGTLGMPFVKRTVNFDDPGSYHFYFGDEAGAPGSLLTFFPHPDGFSGRLGAGQTSEIGLVTGSLEPWIDKFAAEAVPFETPSTKFGKRVLLFRDPDGLRLELVEVQGAPTEIRKVHHVKLWEQTLEPTGALLIEMGAFLEATEGNVHRYRLGDSYVDIEPGAAERGRVAVGSVHHVAFRLPTDASQSDWHAKISERNWNISPIVNRDYFRSIYFREPGGVLFEMATDEPGMFIDEEVLGSGLRLPEWYEPRRTDIEARLQPLRWPR